MGRPDAIGEAPIGFVAHAAALALKSDDRVFDLTRTPLARFSRFHHTQALGSGI
jgi:hypothetical protein